MPNKKVIKEEKPKETKKVEDERPSIVKDTEGRIIDKEGNIIG
uniref:Uncharacterized protein n=1 Tax=viral metagenome TaxID=1070528 RepID=A0A6M3L709_9ZZZZ